MDKSFFEAIRKLLGQNPRGLHISDIASRLQSSRESVTKYLEVLEATGQVECHRYGTARAFCLARRVPASALLNLSSDLVCTLDTRRFLTFANQKFLDFFGLEREEVIGHHIVDIRCPEVSSPPFPHLFSDLLAGEEGVAEVPFRKGGRNYYLRIRGIPTIFEDNSHGITVLVEDVTREHEYVRNLEFLAQTSAFLADMDDEQDIYRYIGEQVAELVPDSIVAVSAIDTETRIQRLAAVTGNPDMVHGLFSGLGITDPDNVSFSIDNVPEATGFLNQRELREGAEQLYIELYRMFPEEVCDRVQEEVGMGKNYAMGCVCRGGLYGAVAIRLRKGNELHSRKTIEAFIRQSGVALQRRHMRKKLQEALQRIRDLEGASPAPG
jgi:PAS domain S-box-containing protein